METESEQYIPIRRMSARVVAAMWCAQDCLPRVARCRCASFVLGAYHRKGCPLSAGCYSGIHSRLQATSTSWYSPVLHQRRSLPTGTPQRCRQHRGPVPCVPTFELFGGRRYISHRSFISGALVSLTAAISDPSAPMVMIPSGATPCMVTRGLFGGLPLGGAGSTSDQGKFSAGRGVQVFPLSDVQTSRLLPFMATRGDQMTQLVTQRCQGCPDVGGCTATVSAPKPCR